MSIPLFPTLQPKLIETGWFNVDQPCDDENEVLALEHEHQNWLNSISQRNHDLIPIGKTATENLEEEEEEDDEDDNDDDESESHDEEDEDEMEMDESQERNSPSVEAAMGIPQNHGVR